MPRATPFRLNRTGLLLALISTAFAGQAGAAAGRVEFAIGPATVVGADGRTRPAVRGIELDTGDTVRTDLGRVQMRMTDGAFISLQPNTEFGIKDYKFEGRTDGSENAFYSLLKGAMRTVTGLIGRVNRNKYQVATPTATVGIRGTGGLIQVLNDGSTLVQGTSGIWFLANPAGTIDIPAGVAGIAPVDPKQPPKETLQIPTAGPSPLPALVEFLQGEEREAGGGNVITPPATPSVLQSGSGYALAAAYGLFSGSSGWSESSAGATAVFNAAGQLMDVSYQNSLAQTIKYTLAQGASHADFGTDGILAWGRWVGPVDVVSNACNGACAPATEIYSVNQGLHYVIGLPTATLPVNLDATYNLIGATKPTFVDGIGSPGTLAGGSLVVNFRTGTYNVNLVDLDVQMSTGQYLLNGSTTTSGSVFTISPVGTGSACFSGCSAQVDGFFAGSNAERAGLSYHISDGIGKQVVGAAALAR